MFLLYVNHPAHSVQLLNAVLVFNEYYWSYRYKAASFEFIA